MKNIISSIIFGASIIFLAGVFYKQSDRFLNQKISERLDNYKKHKYDRFEFFELSGWIWRYDRHTGASYYFDKTNGKWVEVPESTYLASKGGIKELGDKRFGELTLITKSPFYSEFEQEVARKEMDKILDMLSK